MASRARFAARMAIWAASIALAVTGVAWCVDRAYVQPERQGYVDAWRGRLGTMADDRSRAVRDWVVDATGHVNVIATLPSVREAALGEGGAAAANPGRPGPEHLQSVLGALAREVDTVGTWVVGPRGIAASSVRTPLAGAEDVAAEFAARARSDQRTIVAFRRISGVAYVVLAAPLLADAAGPAQGAVVRIDDPAVRLFPAVAAGASSDTSVDSFLVGRDGGDITYLSAVALSGAAPMAMRIPVASAAAPARSAVTTSSEFGAFEDYRGTQVLAATRHVPGTDWGIVVKVDEREVFAPYYEELWILGYVAVALLLGLLGVGWGAWRGQRAAAAAALSRSEARFASLIEDANDPILVVARDGRILLANRRAEALYGRTAAELVAMTDDDLRPPDMRAEIPGDRDRIDAAGGLVFETEHVRADGTRVPVEISSRPLERDGEHVYLAIVRDTTARRAAAAALRASEERERARAADLETILDSLPVGVVIAHDRACRDVTGNRLACEFLGVPPGSSLTMPADGKTPFRAVDDGREIPAADSPLDVSASRGVAINAFELDLAIPGAPRRRVFGNAKPLTGPDGGPRGAVVAFLDVTDHRRMQGEVDVLWRAIEQAPVSVVITDAKGDIEYVNPKFCSVTGYSAADVAGENPRVLKSGMTPPEVYAALWERITTGLAWTGEFQNRRKDGSAYWESAVISPIRDASGRTTHFVAVKEDITARKAQEAALRVVQGDLLQAQKMEAVGRLAGGVAHDFNNLLGVIMGYTEMTLDQLGDDDPRRRGLEEVLGAAERAAGLTRQLLAFSRKQVIEPRVLDLNAVVSGTTRMLGRLVGEDVALDLRLGPALGRVRADIGQVEQVLMNLVVNARDAMPRGGRVEIATRNVDVASGSAPDRPEIGRGRWVVVSIRDTGVGIPMEIRDKIFEPFFTTKDAGKGTGLGLPTVYGIVRHSGGVVRFDSEVGKGTTFEVVLPRWEGPEDVPLAARSVSPRSATGTILLVEDEPVLRGLAKTLLVDAGYEVLTAENANGAIAIAATHEGPIDLLFTDVVMPGAPGPDLALRLTGRIAGDRVLYMSGYTDHPLLQGAELRPGTRLLRKPFTGDGLRRAVASALNG